MTCATFADPNAGSGYVRVSLAPIGSEPRCAKISVPARIIFRYIVGAVFGAEFFDDGRHLCAVGDRNSGEFGLRATRLYAN